MKPETHFLLLNRDCNLWKQLHTENLLEEIPLENKNKNHYAGFFLLLFGRFQLRC
jgi:hypothetical protein